MNNAGILEKCINLMNIIEENYLYIAPAIPEITCDLIRGIAFIVATRNDKLNVLEIVLVTATQLFAY